MSFDKRVGQAALRFLPRVIDPFARVDGAPPKTLWRFLRWCLAGSAPVLAFACVVAVCMGTVEVISAILLGMVVDTAVATKARGFLRRMAGSSFGWRPFCWCCGPWALGCRPRFSPSSWCPT